MACIVLISMTTSQTVIVSAEWWKRSSLPVTKTLVHKPFWLFSDDDRKNQAIVQETSCYEWSNFTVLDEGGNTISTYNDSNCNSKWLVDIEDNMQEKTSIFLDDTLTVETLDNESIDEADAFLNDLFNTSSSFNDENQDTELTETNEWAEISSEGDEIDSLLNNLFTEDDNIIIEGNSQQNVQPLMEESTSSDASEIETETATINVNEGGSLEMNSASSDESEQIINQQDTSDAEIDAFLQDLFSTNVINRLEQVSSSNNVTLSWKALSHAITSFAQNKKELQVGNIKVAGLSGQWYYNSKVATLLHTIDWNFEIDSIKNDFAKNVSNLSYSLSTYLNDDNNKETREAFRKKMINDMKQLQKKYRVLKNKDYIISKSLATRSN